ncbi:hypothetical protein [Amnibacterium soli]|uniref:hypothetical protein n=1 Tax=Amnibacterium soli TaxID=1282736 RepID=UPI0031E6112A
MVALPLAARRRRALDRRVLIGVALIVASALGTTALVGALTRTVVVYRAEGPILAGEQVTAARLAPATVRLGDAAALYLSGALPQGGLVATRAVAAGEMVPRSAVGTATAVRSATVVVDLASPLAAGVAVGSTVDLWSAAKSDPNENRYAPPVVLVDDAVVARVVSPTGLIAGAKEDSVELQVPRDEVAAVLAAQAGGARLAAVEIGGEAP